MSAGTLGVSLVFSSLVTGEGDSFWGVSLTTSEKFLGVGSSVETVGMTIGVGAVEGAGAVSGVEVIFAELPVAELGLITALSPACSKYVTTTIASCSLIGLVATFEHQLNLARRNVKGFGKTLDCALRRDFRFSGDFDDEGLT
jgi:hypothetical protein